MSINDGKGEKYVNTHPSTSPLDGNLEVLKKIVIKDH